MACVCEHRSANEIHECSYFCLIVLQIFFCVQSSVWKHGKSRTRTVQPSAGNLTCPLCVNCIATYATGAKWKLCSTKDWNIEVKDRLMPNSTPVAFRTFFLPCVQLLFLIRETIINASFILVQSEILSPASLSKIKCTLISYNSCVLCILLKHRQMIKHNSQGLWPHSWVLLQTRMLLKRMYLLSFTFAKKEPLFFSKSTLHQIVVWEVNSFGRETLPTTASHEASLQKAKKMTRKNLIPVFLKNTFHTFVPTLTSMTYISIKFRFADVKLNSIPFGDVHWYSLIHPDWLESRLVHSFQDVSVWFCLQMIYNVFNLCQKMSTIVKPLLFISSHAFFHLDLCKSSTCLLTNNAMSALQNESALTNPLSL